MGRISQGQHCRTVVLLEEYEALWDSPTQLTLGALRRRLCCALELAGYAVKPLQIKTPSTLPFALRAYVPGECIIFNWYEGAEWGALDGVQVAALLDDLGYTFTGSDDRTLLLAQDKGRTKRILQAHGIATPRWLWLGADCIDGCAAQRPMGHGLSRTVEALLPAVVPSEDAVRTVAARRPSCSRSDAMSVCSVVPKV